ncbi:Sodium/potassium/calcium exchanger 5 [Pseudolycoriella hygida]|uniref:Sodium/potassium/calcium exchanger 5 n=1 Tax=Pseudolycoriella hygida TaxID=35572 RepID=A0A9Q0N0M0_9DIPT|nr:Sodium/potassium/calcium exchanger 5 [Pseudolycoriella hygida]
MKTFTIVITVGIFWIQIVASKYTKADYNATEPEANSNDLRNDNLSLTAENIDEDVTIEHWSPWKKSQQVDAEVKAGECAGPASSIGQFPEDLFTQEERLQGAVILHFIGAAYFFTVSGLIINYYFIPSVQCICQDLKITPDVGAAVFMASATAMPELFTNLISTFIADSDMGLGAVIGSLMWNILGVASVSSLATTKPVKMDWVPITRDGCMFTLNVLVLIATTWDGYIHWYEAVILVSFSIPYFLIVFQSPRISRFMKRKFEDEYKCFCCIGNHDVLVDHKMIKQPKKQISVIENGIDAKILTEDQKKEAEDKEAYELLKTQRLGLYPCPKDSLPRTIFWYYSWPIRVVLFCTMPNPKTQRRFYILTFLCCIVWIGVVTYLIFFMLIVICHTFSIPESVMGLTVFAIGGCTPELITGFIMAKRGHAGTGLANSFGTSSLGIFMCLGGPWLVSSLIKLYSDPSEVISLGDAAVRYLILSLLLIPPVLWTIFACFKFHLRKLSGICLALTYGSFITWAILIEVQILFPSGKSC